jgi:asparagine synthase (glutamine-hydrolysing)
VIRHQQATVADYLLSDFRDPDATFFEGIKQLRPAHALLVDRDRLRLERYWTVDPSVVARYARDEDYFERFRELFREAVRCRLRSHVPVGVLLSGGIDSTSVTAMAETLRQERPGQPPLFAVTVLSGGFAREDQEAIQRLTARFGTPVHVVHAQATQGSLASEEFSDPRYGAPAFGALTHPKVFEPLASQGCRALLSGLGADHLVGMAELGVLKDLWRRRRFITLAGEIRTMAHKDARIERSILLQLLQQQIPGRARWLIKTLLGRAVPEWIDSRLATRLGLGRRIPASLPVRFPTACQEESFRALTRPETALELNLMDAAAAALRMEGRHPYLDRRLIEFFLSVPAEVKQRAGCFKLFSQRALSAVVPGPLRTQEPEQYLVPIAEDPQSLAFEAEWIEQTLEPSASLLVRYVGAHQLQRLLRALRNGRLEARTPLWKLVQLAWWMEDFFSAAVPTRGQILETVS